MTCLLCESNQATRDSWEGLGGTNVHCEFCGTYEIGWRAIQVVAREFPDKRHILAGVIRSANLDGRTIQFPGLDSEEFNERIQSIIDAAPNAFPQKKEAFLTNLSKLHPKPGESFVIEPIKDRALAFASDSEELVYAVQQLESEGFLKFVFNFDRENLHLGDPDQLGDMLNVQITSAGWSEVSRLSSVKSGKDSTTCFVAMTFKPESREPFLRQHWTENLQPAISSCGYNPILIESLDHAEKIDDRIIDEIRQAKFVIADSTGRNPNVLFEAGYALGIGKTVLWTCMKGEHADQAFDIRQYKQIPWSREFDDTACERIAAAIGNVVGRVN